MVIEKIKEVKRLKFQIKILDEKIEEVRSQMSVQAMKYSDMPKVEGYKQSLLQAQTERLLELETRKNKLQIKIDIILDELAELPEVTYKVVYYRHIDNLSWLEISSKMGYSLAQCHRFYDYANEYKLA